MTATVTSIRTHAWWNSPHPAAELATSIERFIGDQGEDAYIEVGWLYRSVGLTEVHAFVDEACTHLFRRGQYLDDPRNAADLFHDETFSATVGWGEAMAEREDCRLRDLITWFVRTHTASRP